MPAAEDFDELVMTLVEQSLRTPPEERQAHLRSLCREPEVVEEVLLRVEWEERMGRFLLDPLVERSTEPDPFRPGMLLEGRFRIVRKAGFGGMGTVFEAIDEKLDRRVALKCAKPGHGHRLPPEARAAREVSHYNVCKVHDLHATTTAAGEMDFLSMEFIEGETLTERILRDGPLPGEQAREIAVQLCAGLAQAHRQGVIHGDLKCGNVILARNEGSVRAVITDFGLARLKYPAQGQTMASRGGTFDYMAPELFTGHPVSVASDLYALGVLLHIILTGHSPERIAPKSDEKVSAGGSGDTRAVTLTLDLPAIAGKYQRQIGALPQPWKRVVRRCLAVRPADRPGCAEAVAKDLESRRAMVAWAGVPAALLLAAAGYWEWNARTAAAPVRLAILPFSVEGDPVGAAAGMGLDIADRLSGARRNFMVITPREAQLNQADGPAQARRIFGATHVLETRLRGSGAEIAMLASLIDLDSGHSIAQVQGSYTAGDTPNMAKAIIASVTSAFQLRPAVPRESVGGAAYAPYVEGLELLRQGGNANAEKAIADFEQAIRLDANSALLYAGLAEAELTRFTGGDGSEWLDAAGAAMAKARSFNADSVPVLLASGSFEQQHGRYESAVRDLTRATQLEPGNPVALRRLATVYQNTNRPEEAAAAYRQGIEAAPGDFHIYMDFGNFYFYRNQFAQAEEQYRRVVALAPGLANGHMNLGLALIRQYRLPEAERALLEALALGSSPLLLMNLGALYYEEERYQEAARYFEDSIASGRPSSTQYRDLADAYRHLGRTAEAAGAYGKARAAGESDVTRNPRNALLRVRLGLVWAFLGDSARAEFELSQSLAAEPGNPAVMREAAIAYEALKKREKTLELLRNAPGPLLRELSHHPDVRELQQDPQFEELLRKAPAR